MGSNISVSKKDREKKKQSKRLEKQKRKEERKANAGSGSLEDMIAYVDENGVITDTPPDLTKAEEVDVDSIEISIPKKADEDKSILTGFVDFYNEEKGFGFIKNDSNRERFFFHISSAPENIKGGDKVTYELERGPKGMNAVNIEIIK